MNIYQRDFRQTPEIFRLIKAFDNAAAREHLRRHPEEVRGAGLKLARLDAIRWDLQG